MMQQASRWLLAPIGRTQRITNKLLGHALTHRLASNLTGVQIFYCCQIEPAFISGDVGNIGDPHLICRASLIKFTVKQIRCNGQDVFGVGGDSELALVDAVNVCGFT